MSEGKGYVVRGFLDGAAVYAVKREWVYEGGDPPERYATIDAAAAALECMVATGCTDVRVFAVAPDGTETPLPTYEEALTQGAEDSRRLGEIQVLAYQLDAVLRGTMGGDALDIVGQISARTLLAGARAEESAT